MIQESLKPLQTRRARLGEQLISDGLIDEQQLRQGLERQRQTGAFLGETLASLGFITASVIGPYLARATGFPYVDLTEYSIDMECARLVPEHLARRKMLLPIAEQGGELHVAMSDPLDLAAVDDLRARLNRR